MTDAPQASSDTVSEEDKKAFVAYYNENSIIPVFQDIEDPDFIFRRNALYNLLGIPLASLRGRDILELGPGGGFNATAITHFKPRSYVFVDATTASLEELHRKKEKGLFGDTEVEIIESNIFDFADPRTFDLVIIEGVVTSQTKPSEMLRHAASFVSPNGHLVTTTTTATSLLSEVCRRLFRPLVLKRGHTYDEQVAAAEAIFESHLGSLGTRTRPPKDWVQDVILHKWESGAKVAFSMLDSIRALGPDFDFYGSSPRFLIDDRFYKKIDRAADRSNDLLERQFSNLYLALLDYRIGFVDIMKSTQPDDLESLAATLLSIQNDILETNSYDRLDEFMSYLKQIKDMLPEASRQTAAAIDDFIVNFPKALEANEDIEFKEFSKWWGRGQQYVSFTRLDPALRPSA